MSEKISGRLKPCPFCGSEAILKQFGRYAWHVRCENPDCEIIPNINFFDVPEDAVKEWNRRCE